MGSSLLFLAGKTCVNMAERGVESFETWFTGRVVDELAVDSPARAGEAHSVSSVGLC